MNLSEHKCPLCGGNLHENDKAVGCDNWRDADGGCKFVIWKTTCQHEMTEKEVKDIIEKGETEMITDFVSKKGNAFSAQIVLEGGKTIFKFAPRN